ncbi:MAG: hypothetical protein QM831_39990 [Kofleriaceae bacterium]
MKALAFVLLASVTASAKPAASAQAEALFDDAKKLMAKKQYAEACDKFDSSQKLDPAITTLVNAADCREKNKQIATAYGLFLDVERQTRDDAKAKQLHTLAQTRAKKLEGRLSKLTIDVDGATAKVTGLEVKLNADPVLVGSFGTALPTDGGHYTITATAPHRRAFKKELDLGIEKDDQTVKVELRADEAPVPAAVEKPAPPPPVEHPVQKDAPEPPEEQPAPSHGKAAPIAMTIVTVALAGGAVGFELWGRDLLDQSAKEPDNAKQDQLYNDANTRHYIAEGLGAAAIVGAGVTIYLWVRSGSHASESAMIVPTATPNGGGLVLTGRW